MNTNHIARLTLALAQIPSRRDILRRLAGVGLGLGVSRVPDAAEAKKRKHQKKKKDAKAKPNAFGCLDVGKACKRAEQCCSNLCKGKKGRKRCKAHDTGGCPAGHDPFNGDPVVSCLTSSGELGKCATTTGNAGYCLGGGDCRPCTKDADCQTLCGPQAACVVSPVGCSGVTGTVCAGPDEVVCPL